MQGKKPHRNGSVYGIRLGLKLLCLLLCVCFCCGAAAESPSAESEPASPSEDELVAWAQILDYLEVDKWVNYEGVITGDPWFVTCRLPGNVYAIMEPLHEQYAIAFLIIGEDKALLLDTCTGIQNIRRVVDTLTDLPVTVLNSHDHFDHIGGNTYFDEVWCYNLPSAIQHLTQGPTEAEQFEALDSTKSLHPYLKFYGLTIPEKIPGKAPTGTVEDGQVIDLGGRKLEVMHTPGHDSSCIMLLDRENKLLFTGTRSIPAPCTACSTILLSRNTPKASGRRQTWSGKSELKKFTVLITFLLSTRKPYAALRIVSRQSNAARSRTMIQKMDSAYMRWIVKSTSLRWKTALNRSAITASPRTDR